MRMKLIKFPVELQARIADSVNFRQALRRLKFGKSATPRSWVYEDQPADQVLARWTAHLEELRRTGSNKDLIDIAEWDLSKSEKFAPQGEVAPFAERMDTLKEYWEHLDTSLVFTHDDWKLAKKLVIKDFGFNQSGVPVTVDAVIQRGLGEDKYNTSSGDPLFMKRKQPEAIAQAKDAVLNHNWNKYYPVLGSRASMGKTGKKARWIFMFPMSVNLQEQRFQQPLQDYIRLRPKTTDTSVFFVPWEGYNAVQEQLSSLKFSTETPDSIYFGTDFDKMDQHFNLNHAKEVFDVIKHYYKPQYWDELYDSIYYTFNCPVVSPEGLIIGEHSMPSGSGWTNFLETVFDAILVKYLNIRLRRYGFEIIMSMGIGDDMILKIRHLRGKPITDKDIEFLIMTIVFIFNALKLKANEEKQEVSRVMASFLQRRSYTSYHPEGIRMAGVYPTVRALTSLMFPEYYHNSKLWTRNTFALRCIMITENTVNHPLFRSFVEFVGRSNPNILEFAKSPDAAILLERQKAKGIANFIPTYNQEKLNENILNFQTLKILREMK